MNVIEMILLGTFQATIADEVLTKFATDKVRGLFVYLAVEAEHPHRRDKLAALFWPDVPNRTARGNLRKSLHRLRQALAKVDESVADALLTVTRQTVQLNKASIQLDVATFQQHIIACERHQHSHLYQCADCLERLSAAAALYKGELLAGFSLPDAGGFEAWQVVQRERLHLQYLTLLENLAAIYEGQQAFEAAISYGQQLLAEEPWRETMHQQLMRLYVAQGNRAKAVTQYELCQQILADELGVSPSPETTALYQRIQEPEQKTAVLPPTLTHFPSYFSPFVGREEDVAQLSQQLLADDCRLLTLTGMGGIGKTRLSVTIVQAALPQLGAFDTICFVPLASLAEVDLIGSFIARQLGLTLVGTASVEQQLIKQLRGMRLLLVLDNMEHLIAGRELVARLLTAVAGLKIMVTSREPLQISAERRFMVEGLSLDASERLFVQAARQVAPRFTPTDAQQVVIRRIGQLVSGVPLALEMAAAWVRAIDVTVIAKQLEGDVAFLTSLHHDAPDRHRDIRAIFAHSWSLLTVAEQQVLAQMSIFRGGFSLAALQAITQATLANVAILFDKSLLQRGHDDRYGLHELLRQFGAERLDDGVALSQRHATYYLSYVAQQDMETAVWREGITADIDNIRQAWGWAAAHSKAELIEACLEVLATYYQQNGWYGEGATLMKTAVESLSDKGELQVRLWYWQATFLTKQGDYEAAEALLQTALATVDGLANGQQRGEIQIALGRIYQFLGAYDQSRAILAEAYEYYQQQGDRPALADILGQMGLLARRQAQFEAALGYLQEALQIRQALGQQAKIATILGDLGIVHMDRGEGDEALGCYEAALKLHRQLGNKEGIARNLNNIGLIYKRQDRLDEAIEVNEEALQLAREMKHQRGCTICLGNLGNLYKRKGGYERAIQCYYEAIQIAEAIGYHYGRGLYLGDLGVTYKNLGQIEQALACYREGVQIERMLDNPEGLGRILGHMGNLYREEGQYDVAALYVEESIEHLQRAQAKWWLAWARVNKAKLLWEQGAYEAAQQCNDEAQVGLKAMNNYEGLFESQLLQARLWGKLNEVALAKGQLQDMLATVINESQKALLVDALWEATGEAAYGEEAVGLYGKLYQQEPNRQFKQRLEWIGDVLYDAG